ncbi:MAG: hypothetical protein ACR2NQ_04245 [Thermodesulfobacteriota bacterium]
MALKKMDFDANTYIGLGSALVAFFALGVAIWQLKQNSKHNKLSVRPLLATAEQHGAGKLGINTFKIELTNCGTGPAIIKKFALFVNGKEVPRNDDRHYNEFIRRELASFTNVESSHFLSGSSVQVGHVSVVLGFEYQQGQDVNFFRKVNLLVHYQSIYENSDKTYILNHNCPDGSEAGAPSNCRT